jgi:amino acid transporter
MIRGVGLRSAVAINVATMVGAGPFITLPLVVAALHGSVSAVAWVLGALIALCDGLVWAELASRYPRSGGTYTYLREAFGPRGPGRFVAFLFVWQFLFWAPLILASGYIGFAQYAAYLAPALGGYVPTHIVAVAVGIVTLLALYRAIPQIARAALVLGAVALVTLLVVAGAGLTHPYASLAHTIPMTFGFPAGLGPLAALGALGGALVITLYDYGGYGDVCALGDEVVAPVRTIPRAVVLSVLFVGVAYVLLNLGVAVAVPAAEIARSTTIASLVAERAFGAPFAIAVTIAVLITAFGSTYGLLLGASRIPYAAAREGDFLAPFARLHSSGKFPAVSLVVIGLLALPASFFALDDVIKALTAGIVLVQGVGQVVALVWARIRSGPAPFRVPLYPLPAVFALAGWLYLFASTGIVAITFGLGTLVVGAAVYFVRARITRIWPFAVATIAMLLAPVFTGTTAGAAPTFGHSAIVRDASGEPALRVDGEPFFFWGGAFFYERIPADRWRDSMLAMRELGANTLDLYVPWNWHELADGDIDFDGRTNPKRNLREVLRLGAELGFHFIVRPGPVIRNEWRNGGYPAWLLTRPEYDMPLHDVLEGRYPATATLQNAHSDDAAREWMANRTHLRYAARWLHQALAEFRPYADRVIAVQLDDDQAAYIDNQTYPAPNLHRYLGWLEARVREAVGPLTPVFINTYQMRVPSASPVWTMGNWYQSDAFSVGLHDRVELDFSTLLLATNRRGPLAQSEFQAGWLAGPEDPEPRRADPRNTALALDELLALGAKGIIDFPMQDTLAEPGWEAPFSNAAYVWDAALRYQTPPDSIATDDIIAQGERAQPTFEFGTLVKILGPMLVATRRVAPIAIAYAEPSPRADSRPPEGAGAVVARVRAALTSCVEHGYSCDMIDARRDVTRARRYETLVIPPEVALAAPEAAARLRAALRATSTTILPSVPDGRGPGTTTLASPSGSLTFATNWSDAPVSVRTGAAVTVVAPHTVAVRVHDLALAALGAAGDRRRVSSDDCSLRAFPPRSQRAMLALRSESGCTVSVAAGSAVTTIQLRPHEWLSLPDLRRRYLTLRDHFFLPDHRKQTRLAPAIWSGVDDGGDPPADGAVARSRPAIDGVAHDEIVLRNDRLRVIIDPSAGARALSLQAFDAQRKRWSENAFDATGGWRDDVSEPLPSTPRDYIAKYTHAYPAGTFNRAYHAEILASGPRAIVRLTYTMPDAQPGGLTFERIVTLEPRSARVVVDERIIGADGTAQRAVVRSSSPFLVHEPTASGRAFLDLPLDDIPRELAAVVPATAGGIATYRAGLGTVTRREGFVFAVTWRPEDAERATWTPYRSTGTVALTLAPGWRRIAYALTHVDGIDDEAEARTLVEAERAWVGANPAPSRR